MNRRGTDDPQFSTGLPHIVEVQHVWMVDQLHDNDLSLDAQKDLVGSRAGFGHGHSRVQDKSLGYDLDCCVFACDRVFGNLDAA